MQHNTVKKKSLYADAQINSILENTVAFLRSSILSESKFVEKASIRALRIGDKVDELAVSLADIKNDKPVQQIKKLSIFEPDEKEICAEDPDELIKEMMISGFATGQFLNHGRTSQINLFLKKGPESIVKIPAPPVSINPPSPKHTQKEMPLIPHNKPLPSPKPIAPREFADDESTDEEEGVENHNIVQENGVDHDTQPGPSVNGDKENFHNVLQEAIAARSIRQTSSREHKQEEQNGIDAISETLVKLSNGHSIHENHEEPVKDEPVREKSIAEKSLRKNSHQQVPTTKTPVNLDKPIAKENPPAKTNGHPKPTSSNNSKAEKTVTVAAKPTKPAKSIWSDSSDDDTFVSKPPVKKPAATIVTKKPTKPQVQKKGLFDSDSDDEKRPKETVSTEKAAPLVKETKKDVKPAVTEKSEAPKMSNPVSVPKTVPKVEEKQKTSSKAKSSIFDTDSDDEDLFVSVHQKEVRQTVKPVDKPVIHKDFQKPIVDKMPPVVIPPTIVDKKEEDTLKSKTPKLTSLVFDSSSDDDLFSTSINKEKKIIEQPATTQKALVEKKIATFESDDDDDSLFTTPVNKSEPSPEVSLIPSSIPNDNEENMEKRAPKKLDTSAFAGKLNHALAAGPTPIKNPLDQKIFTTRPSTLSTNTSPETTVSASSAPSTLKKSPGKLASSDFGGKLNLLLGAGPPIKPKTEPAKETEEVVENSSIGILKSRPRGPANRRPPTRSMILTKEELPPVAERVTKSLSNEDEGEITDPLHM